MIPRTLLIAVLFFVGTGLQAAVDTSGAVLWPEHQRAFIQDAPSLLLSDEQKTTFLAASSEERDRLVDEFYAQDPIPETEENELVKGIERRMALTRQEELLNFLDHRAQVLFLNGSPKRREIVDCGMTFMPIEIWFYGPEGAEFPLVLYQPTPEASYRLWFPTDSKRILYTDEMEYIIAQVEELGVVKRGLRWLKQVCPNEELVADATGIDLLRGFRENRPTDRQVRTFLATPVSLATWSQSATATPLPADLRQMDLHDLEILFPDKLQQRMITRFVVSIPSVAGLEITTEEDEPGLVLSVDGVIVQVENTVDGQLWLIVGYRGGNGAWLQIVPLLPHATGNEMRSIYDGPDPTTGFSNDDEEDTAKDEPEIPELEAHGDGPLTIPQPIGRPMSSDD